MGVVLVALALDSLGIIIILYGSARAAALDIVTHVRDGILDHVVDAVKGHVERAVSALNMMCSLLPPAVTTGNHVSNPQLVSSVYACIYNIAPLLYELGFTNNHSGRAVYFSVGTLGGRVRWIFMDDTSDFRVLAYTLLGPDLDVVEWTLNKTGYVPLQRQWYRDTLGTGRATWTVSRSFVSPWTFFVLGQPVRDQQAACFVVFLFEFVDMFLRNLSHTPHGVVFVTDAAGHLVSTSVAGLNMMASDGSLLDATDSDNAVIALVAAELRDRGIMGHTASFDLSAWFVDTRALVFPGGLLLQVVVVNKQDELIGFLTYVLNVGIGISVAVGAVAAAVVGGATLLVTRALSKLTRRLCDVAVMELPNVDDIPVHAVFHEIQEMQLSVRAVVSNAERMRAFLPELRDAHQLQADDEDGDTVSASTGTIKTQHSDTTTAALATEVGLRTAKIAVFAAETNMTTDVRTTSVEVVQRHSAAYGIVLEALQSTSCANIAWTGHLLLAWWPFSQHTVVLDTALRIVQEYAAAHGRVQDLPRMRLAVCSGRAHIGIVGNRRTKTATAIGPVVDRACQLLPLCEHFESPLLIDEDMHNAVQFSHWCRLRGAMRTATGTPCAVFEATARIKETNTTEWMYELAERNRDNPHKVFNAAMASALVGDDDAVQRVRSVLSSTEVLELLRELRNTDHIHTTQWTCCWRKTPPPHEADFPATWASCRSLSETTLTSGRPRCCSSLVMETHCDSDSPPPA